MSDPVNPNPAPAAQPVGKRGGPDFHKPGCRCNACVARRRKAEALAERARSDAPPEALQPPSEGTVLNDTDEALAVIGKPKTAYNKDAVLVGTDIQRHRVKMWLQWKAIEPKLTHAEAAARLDIAPQTLTNLLHRASKAGWLQFDNPMDELEYKQLPKVNEVINYHLDQGDKDVAVKMAQATIWKQYAASKGANDSPQTVIAFKIEMPPGAVDAASVPIKGVIVGSPRTIDAEIIEESNE